MNKNWALKTAERSGCLATGQVTGQVEVSLWQGTKFLLGCTTQQTTPEITQEKLGEWLDEKLGETHVIIIRVRKY
ncbi:hypothetical protein KJ068_27380 [bacterium]|nr:hypothetical protein [bacterium]